MAENKIASQLRRYTIEVKDLDSGQSFLIAADWEDSERRVALAQIMRLAGVPGAAVDSFLEDAAPADHARKN